MGESPSTRVVSEEAMQSALQTVLRELLEPAARLEALRRKELLTGEEVEDLYGLNAGTLCNLRTQGRGPKSIRLGKSVRYRHADILAYISANQVKTYDQQH